MTNKFLSGAYAPGYSLSGSYTGVVVTATGSVGGSGLKLSAGGYASIQHGGVIETAAGQPDDGVFLGEAPARW